MIDDYKYLIFSRPNIILLQNKKFKLIAEMDLFNNHIEFQITNLEETIIYNYSFDITDAIRMYCEKVGEI